MSTKSAKRIFGSLYSILKPEEFYNKVLVINASNTIQEIIYDSILNSLNNLKVK
jgi:hypothetical protein